MKTIPAPYWRRRQGGLDDIVIELNREAYARLKVEKRLAVVHGATHLSEEPGTLEEAARSAADWFKRHLQTLSSERGK